MHPCSQHYYNSQEVVATRVSYLQMNVNTYNGMFFNLKKERNSDRCYNISVLYLENIMLSEINQAQKDKFYMIPFV